MALDPGDSCALETLLLTWIPALAMQASWDICQLLSGCHTHAVITYGQWAETTHFPWHAGWWLWNILASLPPIPEVINSWLFYLPINSSSTVCLLDNQTPKLWPSSGNMLPTSPTGPVLC